MIASPPLQLPGNGIARQLRCRGLQSPLAGVSDRVFRSLVRRWAPDALLFTEMVNATSLEMGHGLCKVESLAEDPGPSACNCSTIAPRPWLMQHDGLKPVGPF